MRYESVVTLLEKDESAKAFFQTLSDETRAAILAHGAGVNSLEELKHFTGILRSQGCK